MTPQTYHAQDVPTIHAEAQPTSALKDQFQRATINMEGRHHHVFIAVNQLQIIRNSSNAHNFPPTECSSSLFPLSLSLPSPLPLPGLYQRLHWLHEAADLITAALRVESIAALLALVSRTTQLVAARHVSSDLQSQQTSLVLMTSQTSTALAPRILRLE